MQTDYGDGRDVLTPIPPGVPLSGSVVLPGSKSITNRALLVAALASGSSQLHGALKSVDTELMSTALRQMGVGIDEPGSTRFCVHGNGRLVEPEEPLFLGNAGTATRFLTAAATLVDGAIVIDGDDHMRTRPILPLVEALSELGADVSTPTGCPPLSIRGAGKLRGGQAHIDGSLSSQYVSALLMIAPMASGPVQIALTGKSIGARGYIDLTLAVMSAFGARVEPMGDIAWRVEPTGYRSAEFTVEPDASAATYLWAAEVLTGGDIDLGISASDFTQPDARAHEMIAAFPNMPAEIDGSQMQDAVPTLAVLAAFNQNPVRFTGIANLRVKECDRIAALAEGLCAIAPGLGAEDGDDLVVSPKALAARGKTRARIATYNDHRMAMAFALAGLRLAGIAIENPDCTAKTFPDYWEVLAGLGVHFEEMAPNKAGLT